MGKFNSNGSNNKFMPVMNTTMGSQGNATAKLGSSNPFIRSASKQGPRSKAISRGNASNKDSSQVSKKSFEQVQNESFAMEKLNEQLRERDLSP